MVLARGAMLGMYQIVSAIGAGGMGEVFLARDTRLDRRVALKVLPPEFERDDDRRRRFTREARAAAALSHPNVATIYEIGHAAGVSYIAMEYVEGVTLADRIASSRSCSARDSIALAQIGPGGGNRPWFAIYLIRRTYRCQD